MSDFNNIMKEYMGSEVGIKHHKDNLKTMTAELYNQSKNVKKVGDKKEVTI